MPILRWIVRTIAAWPQAIATAIGIAVLPAAGCAPRYVHSQPLEPSELWTPLPIQYIDVGGVEIAFLDSGPVAEAPGPPVVLIHGLSSYIGFWEYQIEHLARRHRVLALDLPGYGASARPDAPYTPPWFARIVDDWLAAIEVDQAIVVGHSMGGQIAMTLALEHPDRVHTLVLSAPAGIERFRPGHAAWLEAYYTESRTYDTVERDIRHAFSLVFNRHDEGVERLLAERIRMKGTGALQGTSVAVSRSISGMLRHPVFDRLPEIDVPTLVVFGAADKLIPNPILNGGRTEHIARIAGRVIPGAEVVVIPTAGHTVHHDAPDRFNREVDAFLDGVAAGDRP